jgi:phenylalanyl-tRNA synthetase beta chain
LLAQSAKFDYFSPKLRMKITYNWLKHYVQFDWPPEELARRLTLLGLEVEGVVKVGGEFDGVVVAQVITRDKHPNADKLSLCRVNDGAGERQIVCGAQNFKAGDKVPLILPGKTLPAKSGEPPLTIKVGKIRGVESQGMLCSPAELGMSSDSDGLLILREDAKVGQPFAEYLGRPGADIVYDLEVTPNRPDWNSVIGIAREISALTGNPLTLPEITVPAAQISPEPIGNYVGVRVEGAELCPRYNARLLRGLKIAPSPDWMRALLEKAGLRAINNIVDATNFVMLEIGQPLHAFDFHLLAAKSGALPMIVVHKATAGEEFVTLDSKKHILNDQALLIADETQPLALAGIMGGKNSEINSGTVDVLIESACFKPQNIRATSKKLALRTDSSYRFERGADIGICEWAGRRAAHLILQTAGGVMLENSIDTYPAPAAPKKITLRFAKCDELLGVAIPAAEQTNLLRRLQLEVVEQQQNAAVFQTPSFRVDLKREVDLIEEVARLYGIDKIPSTPPRGALGANTFDTVHDEIAEARRLLAGLGLNEVQGQTLISETDASSQSGANIVRLTYPLSADMNVLRSSLLPGLLATLRHNISHKNNDVAVFEIGRVFTQLGDRTCRERRNLALAITGARSPVFWDGAERDARYSLFDLKGVLEEFLDQFGVRGASWVKREGDNSFFLESASVCLGKLTLGEIGQLSPAHAKLHDLRDAVLLAELDFDELLSRRTPGKSFKPLPQFPSIRRDIAMLVPETITHEAISGVVKQTKPANLERVELFDVFRGKTIPAGQKSVAYAFIYRSSERTLTDAEVNTAHEKLVGQFKQSLQATVRDS